MSDTIINLTPHAIVLQSKDGQRTEYPPSGKVVRVVQELNKVKEVNGVDVEWVTFGRPIDLPPPQPNTYYVVSMPVAQQCNGRDDLLCPNTSRAIRNDKGEIIAVENWAMY
jgi:hypothetical protein